MAKGASKISASGGGAATQPKSKLETQIDNLEQNIWRGSGKALHADSVQVGDTIEGIQYSFDPNYLAPVEKKGAWSGDYNGIPMRFSADGTFQVVSVQKGANATTITATKVGGAGGTVKKKIPNNDVYLRVWKRRT